MPTQVCKRPGGEKEACRCATEGRVYDIHNGVGVPNMTAYRVASAGKPYHLRAQIFEGYAIPFIPFYTDDHMILRARNSTHDSHIDSYS